MTDEMEGSASVELSAQGGKKRFLWLQKWEINTHTGTEYSLSTGTKTTGQM